MDPFVQFLIKNKSILTIIIGCFSTLFPICKFIYLFSNLFCLATNFLQIFPNSFQLHPILTNTINILQPLKSFAKICPLGVFILKPLKSFKFIYVKNFQLYLFFFNHIMLSVYSPNLLTWFMLKIAKFIYENKIYIIS